MLRGRGGFLPPTVAGQEHEFDSLFEELFQKLGRRGDGMVDIAELQEGLEALGFPPGGEEVDLVGDAIQPTHPLSSPSPPALNLSQHQGLFKLGIDMGDRWTFHNLIDEKRKSGHPWKYLLAGGIAGTCARTCTVPLERLKTLMQFRNKECEDNEPFNRDDERGWRGNCTNILKLAPEIAVKIWSYEQYKEYLSSEGAKLGTLEKFASASLAGATSQSFIYRLEVLKTNLAVSKTGQYAGLLDYARKIWKLERITGFYKGYILSLLTVIPYASIDITLYELLKTHWLNTHAEDPGLVILMGCCTFCNFCGQFVSYPLNLVRTCKQWILLNLFSKMLISVCIIKALYKSQPLIFVNTCYCQSYNLDILPLYNKISL
ncbi:hypothetical protein FD754_004462 [Muntiacus muntjak]|uniref:EF-hand domain-containing protein n=1 Tax=Muntiacus muntjak TaxID=9888 RepID=A0A5N3WJ65_MUNMU|nr:hypothetical protein FD754_004462 [Muntiacus muntjak]